MIQSSQPIPSEETDSVGKYIFRTDREVGPYRSRGRATDF